MRKSLILIMALSCALLLAGRLGASPQAPSAAAKSTGTLEIMVVDESEKPLQGVQVSLPGHRAVTDVKGSCRFNVLVGRYPILIRKDGYRGRRVNAGVRPGETTTTQVQLQKLLPARQPRK
jgi:uncharacterized membrane protein